jgi:hypothetical protein
MTNSLEQDFARAAFLEHEIYEKRRDAAGQNMMEEVNRLRTERADFIKQVNEKGPDYQKQFDAKAKEALGHDYVLGKNAKGEVTQLNFTQQDFEQLYGKENLASSRKAEPAAAWDNAAPKGSGQDPQSDIQRGIREAQPSSNPGQLDMQTQVETGAAPVKDQGSREKTLVEAEHDAGGKAVHPESGSKGGSASE